MKTKKQQSSKPARNTYTAQYKQQAVERADREGVPTVAKDLGLPASQLYNWRTALRQTGKSFEYQSLQQADMARMKREVEALKQENDFLKKAAAYFAKQPK